MAVDFAVVLADLVLKRDPHNLFPRLGVNPKRADGALTVETAHSARTANGGVKNSFFAPSGRRVIAPSLELVAAWYMYMVWP